MITHRCVHGTRYRWIAMPGVWCIDGNAAPHCRCAWPPQPMTKVTARELAVLADVAADLDPWRNCKGAGSRAVSQAFARLERKFLVESYVGGRRITNAGRAVLKAATEKTK